MLSSLVVSSSSNAVKFSSLFKSLVQDLGIEISFLILDHTKNMSFDSFSEQRMYYNGVVHYLNPKDNTIEAHKINYQQTEVFCVKLKDYFLEDLKIVKPVTSNFVVSDSAAPIQFFDKDDIVDLKYNKNLKNIQLEIKNKGLVSFDHLFVEQTDSCLEFIKTKSESLVKASKKSDLVWGCYNYKLSSEFSQEDFWFLENRNYQSVFDNCFYLQPRKKELSVWALIPEHQYLNQQFHNDFQDRIRKKIEATFSFVSLSFVSVTDQTVHLMNSQKMRLNENLRVSGFPCFSFYSNENVYEWFNHFYRDFSKMHKIKKLVQRA